MRDKRLCEMTRDERENTVRNAVSILQQDYYADVRGVTEDAVEHLREAYHDDGQRGEELRESLLTWLHETIDGHCRVIYTFEAQKGLLVSDNAGAYVEEFGEEGATSHGDLNWSALMYAAMERDVYEELHAMGLDPNDPESHFAEKEAAEE